MLRRTGILATIGATAPFVGLFGTVWGTDVAAPI
jgi:biopolymer transport protein ExbB/TolQ